MKKKQFVKPELSVIEFKNNPLFAGSSQEGKGNIEGFSFDGDISRGSSAKTDFGM